MSSSEPLTIGYIVGSLSSHSINRVLSQALVTLAPENVTLVEIPIKDLPFYNQDLEADFPAVAREFKNQIEAVDGVIIVTPEYSRSLPGVLKNALEWAGRPYGDRSFNGKPTAVIGASPGAIGTALAQSHLKSILNHYHAPTLGQPEGFITFSPEVFLPDGTVTSESTQEFLRTYLDAFIAFIGQNSQK